MANMSYCRFSNTYLDLKDCVNVLEEHTNLGELNLNSEELIALNRIYTLCQMLVENVNRLKEEDYE